MTDDEVLARIAELQRGDLPTHGGRTLAYVYDSGVPGLDELAATAHAAAAHANALDPTAFGSIAAMEADLIASAAALLGGGPDTAGAVTSGGTESCLLAVQAARDSRPDIREPRMVLPTTTHAAFHKAAHYFGVAVDSVDVDPRSFRADPAAIAAVIGPDTVLVVCSAPSYAHGVIDPVPEIAAMASAGGVRCHVDACIGGWLLGGWRASGDRDVPPFDLAVPGVTSLSVDLHKYAYTPKGTSVLLHANADLRAPQYFVFAGWPGYTMLNTTTQSTRSGGPVAAAWAVLSRLGGAGYAELGRLTAGAVDELRAGIATIPGLRILGEPDASLLAVAADPQDDGTDVFVVADEMAVRGFYVQPQFAFASSPPNLHLTVTAANAGHTGELVGALRESAAAARLAGPAALPPGIAETLGSLGPGGFGEVAGALGLIGTDGALVLPQRMATLNALLNAIPGAMREELLRQVLGLIHRQGRSLIGP